MKEKVFKTQEELANFFNRKAAEGFPQIKISTGTVLVEVRAESVINAVPKNQSFTLVYSENSDNVLAIADIL